MCAADTNLEVVSRQNHTTNGWGKEKKCRDYKSVVEYAELLANSTDTGTVPGASPNHYAMQSDWASRALQNKKWTNLNSKRKLGSYHVQKVTFIL